MQSRIDLASKLCSKDPRACYLIDEYRNFKFNEEDKEINSDNINRKSILEKWGDKLKEFLDNA